MPKSRPALRAVNAGHVHGQPMVPASPLVVASVVIVDDHDIVCEGLRNAFEASDDFSVVGMAGARLAALDLVAATTPDLLLLDVNIPGSGIETARQISTSFPSVKILMLSAYDDDHIVRNGLLAGASGYLHKGVAARELLDVARQVLAGECFIPTSLAARLLATGRSAESTLSNAPDYRVELMKREEAILQGISQGRSNAELAGHLSLSEHTVKSYVTNIMQKLHARNRVEVTNIGYHRILARFQNDD